MCWGGILVLIFTNQIRMEIIGNYPFEFEFPKSVDESVGWGMDLGIDFHH